MSEPKIITIKIKYKDERAVKQKFLVYEELTASVEDPEIEKLIEETKNGCEELPEGIKVSITFDC